ncbi:MAG: deoxynucleoside kinase [Acidobacteria bacterium]|nr:deoxynucleoside kinase [Acidobacteriota bacterium]
MRLRYIAVEGPIGVGKTSLVEVLAHKLKAAPLFEESENPFLAEFYRNREKAAFKTQLFFLLTRYQQQQGLRQQDLFFKLTISDYLFEKDRIFAYLNLADAELIIYEKLYSLLVPNVPSPDLVIYLQASTDVLWERIKKRKKKEEASLSLDYLEEVNQAYNRFFFHYNKTPLLVVNTSEVDFTKKPEEVDELIREISRMGRGTRYYVPLGSR